ncbi:MAG: glutamate--tRNA ligase [Candidatus Levybacteria bacterium]|nr:glutamate--tRNA ligase [Candidatus Levybacteria bacterium]
MVRTRFAPSPTGVPHVGNIRTALFNYFFARANNGVFILRIEDTDQARLVEGAVDAIQESLKWLGIDWDEYAVQSERLSEYKKYADELVSRGLAKHEDGAIRFLIPKDGLTFWIDTVGNKKIEFKNSEIEDFIILKKDGFPTYHLANVIDDHVSNITHVIRGEDWISSTPKHILLYRAFDWQVPRFAHVPNVHESFGKKLSKRKGAKSVLDFKSEGFLSSALLNYLMLLGWSPKDDREILSKEEIVKEFSLEKINVSPAIFDLKKLEWMNGVYIRQLSVSELRSHLRQGFGGQAKLKNIDESLLDKFIPLAQTRMTTLNDFYDQVVPFIEELKIELNEKEKQVAKKLLASLSSITNWNSDEILLVLKNILKEENVRMPVIYKILTGKETGLPLSQTLEILGEEKVIKKLEKAIDGTEL